jgi:acyl-coenzyme A synthetase/AMP-(fatty) acid ligase
MNVVEPVARRALIQPDAPAVITDERTLTYGALMRDVVTISSRLAEEGVKRGDVVAIVAEGLAAHILLTLAVSRIGAVSLAFSQMQDEDLAFFVQACGVSFVVYNGPALGSKHASPTRKRLSLAELATGKPAAVAPMVRPATGEQFRIAFSSGTTGRPKAVKFTHDAILLRSHLLRMFFPAAPGRHTLIGMSPSLHFSIGYWLLTLMAGGALVDHGADMPAMEAAIRRHSVNLLVTSPGNAVELVKIAQARGDAPSPDLQAVFMGGARVAPALQEVLRRHLCPNLYVNFGVTESGGLVAQADPDLLQSDPSCAGRLLPWVEMEALDEHGQPLPPGSEGQLRVRTPYLASGYVGSSDGEPFRDGWFHSSDVGVVTADGLLYVGARSEVLNFAGAKFSAESVESVVAEDTAILECVALTLPDRMQQQQLVVAVVSPQGFDLEALRRRCADKLGAALVPKAVITLESLPHNAGGKILRPQVPALVAQRIASLRAQQPPAGPLAS